MATYAVISPIAVHERRYEAGETVELDDATAARLRGFGCIVSPGEPPPEPPKAPEPVTPETHAKVAEKVHEANVVGRTYVAPEPAPPADDDAKASPKRRRDR